MVTALFVMVATIKIIGKESTPIISYVNTFTNISHIPDTDTGSEFALSASAKIEEKCTLLIERYLHFMVR